MPKLRRITFLIKTKNSRMMKNIKTVLIVAFFGVIILIAGKGPEAPPQSKSYDFKMITVVESVVPGGLGRSRMITTGASGSLEEVKLKNFFSLVGINFNNIKQNDVAITDKITSLYENGWELVDVTSGVYSSADMSVTDSKDGASGSSSSTGIFITRYLFKQVK